MLLQENPTPNQTSNVKSVPCNHKAAKQRENWGSTVLYLVAIPAVHPIVICAIICSHWVNLYVFAHSADLPHWHMGFEIWGLRLADLLASRSDNTSCLFFDLKHFRSMPTTCITHASSRSFASFLEPISEISRSPGFIIWTEPMMRHTYVQITCNFETQIPEKAAGRGNENREHVYTPKLFRP